MLGGGVDCLVVSCGGYRGFEMGGWVGVWFWGWVGWDGFVVELFGMGVVFVCGGRWGGKLRVVVLGWVLCVVLMSLGGGVILENILMLLKCRGS